MKIAISALLFALLHLAAAGPTPLSTEEAERLSKWTPSDGPMWQISGQEQGDMVLNQEQLDAIKSPEQQRNGLINTNSRWPNRVIPYEISNDFTESEKQFIRNTVESEYARTCIRVRPRTASDRDYIRVTGQNTGCWSYVGRQGGQQQLNLQRSGCLWFHTVGHEFLHAAGFYHQQSATERDSYVTINWGNIQQGQEHNFDKYGSNVISNFGVRYDYGSVMHYGNTAFSKNGYPTITPRESNALIGQAQRLSNADILKLNKMYGCA